MFSNFQFQRFDGSLWPWACALVALVVGYCVLKFFRAEQTAVSDRIGRALMLLRVTVIAVLFLIALQPVLQNATTGEKRGAIVVAVDVSASMSEADERATGKERKRWARALGRHIADDTGDEWQQSLVEDIAKLTRTEMVGQLLATREHNNSTSYWQRMAATADVCPLLFAGKAVRVESDSLTETIGQLPTGLEIDTETTRLAAALELDQLLTAAERNSLRGIVLLTDGRDIFRNEAGSENMNSPEAVLELAKQWGQRSAPIYPVLIGSEQPEPSISIAAFDYPDWVMQGRDALLKIDLHDSTPQGSGDGQPEIELVVTPETGEPVKRRVQLRGQQTIVQWPLEIPGEGTGTQKFALSVSGDDNVDQQNLAVQIPFVVRVVDDKTDILILEQAARWEFRFLQSLYDRDAQTDVRAVLFDQPKIGLLDRNFYATRLNELNAADSKQMFAGYDLVVLGDAAPENISLETWQQLDRFVAKDGGTLLFLAGPGFGEQCQQSADMRRLLPIDNVQPIRVGSNGFLLRLTADGESELAFQLATKGKDNLDVWSTLPNHFRGWTGDLRPGASALAIAQTGETSNDDAVQQQPVIAHRFHGLGQVLWQGVDSSWRWRRGDGEKYHRRYWLQLAEWAARHRANMQNSVMRIELDCYRMAMDEATTVRVHLAEPDEEAEQKQQPESYAIHVFSADQREAEPTKVIPLRYVDAAQRELTAEIKHIPAGKQTLFLVSENGKIVDPDLFTELLVESPLTNERKNRQADASLLTAIAESSGGQMFYPDQLPELMNRLDAPAAVDVETSQLLLWNHWSVLLLILILLTAEWTIRKRNGLP